MSKWIKTRDHLPPKGVEVLVYITSVSPPATTVGYRLEVPVGGDKTVTEFYTDIGNHKLGNRWDIPYWRRLPEPPIR